MCSKYKQTGPIFRNYTIEFVFMKLNNKISIHMQCLLVIYDIIHIMHILCI